jgi:hypothetical protein
MSGDPQIQADIRDEFCLYKAVCNVSEVTREFNHSITEEVITAEFVREKKNDIFSDMQNVH